MFVSQKLQHYYSELIQPISTNVYLERMFKKLKKKIITKFEKIFKEQCKKKLEEIVSFQENAKRQLLIKNGAIMNSIVNVL